MTGVVRAKPNWVPTLVFYALSLPLVIANEFDDDSMVLVFGLPILILATVFGCILHYRCWNALPSTARRTTPGRAVGLLFVPFYNFYWVFVSVRGLAEDMAKYNQSLGLTTFKNYTALATAYSVIIVCEFALSWIPWLGGVLGVTDFILWVIIYQGISANASALIDREPSGIAE